jgi:hypothetical protein
LRVAEQYYALCVVEENKREVALLDLGREEGIGQLIGIAVYTALDGEAQRKHLEEYGGSTTPLGIAPVSYEELLEAVNRARPVSVFYDGHQIAGSVMKGLLHDTLGMPIREPRILDSDRVFGDSEE